MREKLYLEKNRKPTCGRVGFFNEVKRESLNRSSLPDCTPVKRCDSCSQCNQSIRGVDVLLLHISVKSFTNDDGKIRASGCSTSPKSARPRDRKTSVSYLHRLNFTKGRHLFRRSDTRVLYRHQTAFGLQGDKKVQQKQRG